MSQAKNSFRTGVCRVYFKLPPSTRVANNSYMNASLSHPGPVFVRALPGRRGINAGKSPSKHEWMPRQISPQFPCDLGTRTSRPVTGHRDSPFPVGGPYSHYSKTAVEGPACIIAQTQAHAHWHYTLPFPKHGKIRIGENSLTGEQASPGTLDLQELAVDQPAHLTSIGTISWSSHSTSRCS